MKRCKDCEPNTKRDAPYPGPRCATHHRRLKKERARQSWEAHIYRTYGITAEDYEQILKQQEGRCAICRRANGKTKRLAVDHDHETNRVRGLLCKPCNRMLGHGRDDPEFFNRAATYLDFPPALAAGVDQLVAN